MNPPVNLKAWMRVVLLLPAILETCDANPRRDRSLAISWNVKKALFIGISGGR